MSLLEFAAEWALSLPRFIGASLGATLEELCSGAIRTGGPGGGWKMLREEGEIMGD